MKQVVIIALVLAALPKCVWASGLSIKPSAVPMGGRPPAMTSRIEHPSAPTALAVLGTIRVYASIGESAESRVIAKSTAAINSQGILVDVTQRDLQANSTIGRMVAVSPNEAGVQFTYGRRLSTDPYNVWGVAAYRASSGTFVVPGKGIVQNALSGQAGAYPRIVVLNDGRAVIGGYDTFDATASPVNYQLHVVNDLVPFLGAFPPIDEGSRMSDSLEGAHNFVPGSQSLWPTIDICQYGGEPVIYLASYESGGNYQGAMKVFRKVGLSTESNPDTSWKIVFVDTATYPSQDISCSRVSNKVGVAWTNYTATGKSTNDQTDADVWYAESPTGTVGTWTRTNVTNYVGPTYRAWIEVSSLFDGSDKYHIIWNARKYDSAAGGFYTKECQLFHWSQWLPSQIQTVYNAEWDYRLATCWSTSNALQLAHFSLAECDGRLFAAFTSYNDMAVGYGGNRDDCGRDSPYANGEVNVIASSDLQGVLWERRPHNVSLSYSGNCASGDCADDGYVSLSRYGIDDAAIAGTEIWPDSSLVDPSGTYSGSKHLQLFYLTDRDPGSSVQGVGAVTDNDLRWLRLACYNPFTTRLELSPTHLGAPLTIQPGQQRDFQIQISNVGTAPIIISNTEIIAESAIPPAPAGWLDITFPGESSPFTLEPQKSVLGTVHVNVGGIVTLPGTALHGEIVVGGTAAETLAVNIVVADTSTPYPSYQVLQTSCLSLVVGSDGDAGMTGELVGGLNFHPSVECDSGLNSRGEARTYLFDASPVVLRSTGTGYRGSYSFFQVADTASTLIFRKLAGTSAPQYESTAKYESFCTGAIASRDSLVMVERTWYAPKDPDSCSMVLQKTIFYPRIISQPVTDLVLGEVFDWDIAADAAAPANSGGYDAPSRMVWFRGYHSLAPGGDCQNNSERFGGAAYLWSHLKDGVIDSTTFSAYYASNWDYIFPDVDFNLAELWANMSAVGTPSISEPYRDDLHGAIRYRTAPFVLPANDTLTVWTVIASSKGSATLNAGLPNTSTSGLTDLIATITKAKIWYQNLVGPSGCCVGVVGNVDCDPGDGVDVGDLTTLIDNLFITFTSLCCEAEANCDGDATGNIDVADVTALIDNLFITFTPLPACQ